MKRNSKKELAPATGKRVRASSIYKPYQTEDFKITRGKFSDFLTCPRCFYMDRMMVEDQSQSFQVVNAIVVMQVNTKINDNGDSSSKRR